VPDTFLHLQAAIADRYALVPDANGAPTLLGRGGMATVFLADDLRHHRRVALKVLHSELAVALGPERFLREIQIAARLTHPHILALHDSGTFDWRPGIPGLFYVMPRVVGESLRQRLTRERHLAVDEAIRIAREIGEALDYAHRQGVVHRDVKPENILLDGYPPAGGAASGWHALLADFGIARAITGSLDAGTAEKLTETGFSLGTPAYMSPEQAAGSRDLDARSDLYSLGCVVYEMLAGEPPFTGRSAQAILARHALDPVPPLRTVRAAVPESVERAVVKALGKVPADRFATSGEFVAAMQSREAVATVPRLPASPRLSRLRRLSKSLVVGLAAAVALGTAAAVRFWRNTPSAALDPNLLAVAPFDVVDPKLALWREGLVDYLTKNLDGAGQLHVVAPAVVLQRWKGRADAGSARALGRRSGARVVVFGNLSPAARDSVRIRATVLDAASGASVAEFEGVDQLDRVGSLADSLTLQVLRGLGRTVTGGYVRLSSVGTRSIPALKAYLKGEQYLRRARYDSADVSFSRAVALDSTFALALLRLGDTRSWTRGGNPGELHLRAARFNRGLSPRDSLLITVDSLRAAVGSGQDSTVTRHRSRMLELMDQARSLNPDDPEVLLLRADLQFHHEGYAGGPEGGERGVRQGFDAAIALDSSFAPAYIHPIELAGDEAHARPYVAGYLKAVVQDRRQDWVALLAKLLDAPAKKLRPFLDSLPTAQLDELLDHIHTWHDSAEIAVQVGRVYYLRRDNPEAGSGRPQSRLARLLAFRGHLREARATLGDRFGALLVDLGLVGTIPADSASALAAAWFRNPNPVTFGETFPVWPATTDPVQPYKDNPRSAALWWTSRRDTSSVLALAAAELVAGKNPEGSPGLATASSNSDFTRAALALARADTAAALRQFLALPDSIIADDWRVRLLRFQLLAASGRHSQAAAVFNEQILPPLSPVWVLGVLEVGRMAERDGARNRAAECYRFVSDVWRHADPELQPYIAQARAGFERVRVTP
jgi:eukaryotic-like serine/threonine-protein kinase